MCSAKLVSGPLEEAKKQIQDLKSKLEELNKSLSDSALELEKTVILKDVKILELTAELREKSLINSNSI